MVKSQQMAFIHAKSICEWCNIPAYYLIFANVPEHTFFYTPAQPILQVTYEQRISWHNCFVTVKYAMHLNIIMTMICSWTRMDESEKFL